MKQKARNIGLFFAFVMPTVAIWVSVVVVPFFYGTTLSFTDWNGMSETFSFIGLDNFMGIFRNTAFLQSILKTFVYAFFVVLLSNLLALGISLLLTKGFKGQSFFRAGFFTPNIIGGIVLGYIWNFIFSFAMPQLGKALNIDLLSKSWLTNPTLALVALIIVTTWQLSGYLMMIYIAGLTNVPKELLEASDIDGASGLQTLLFVKLPMIRSALTVSIFLSITRSFMAFDLNLALTAGGPFKSTELISYKIYQTAFTAHNFGGGQAQALVLFIIVAVISITQVYLTRKGEVEA